MQNGTSSDLRTLAQVASAPPFELVFSGRDAWQAGLQQHLLALQCSVAEPQTFKCNAIIARLYGNTVAELRVDASRLQRRASDANSAADQVQVMWQLTGRSRVRQGPNGATLEAGTWTLFDPAREFEIEFEHGSRCLLLLVPQAQCGGWLSPLDALSALALPAGGPAHVALAMLSAVLREVTRLDEVSERTLHESCPRG
jgi:hypothetical protein